MLCLLLAALAGLCDGVPRRLASGFLESARLVHLRDNLSLPPCSTVVCFVHRQRLSVVLSFPSSVGPGRQGAYRIRPASKRRGGGLLPRRFLVRVVPLQAPDDTPNAAAQTWGNMVSHDGSQVRVTNQTPFVHICCVLA